MRILFTSRHYLPRIGGLQLSVHQLVLRLIERGHDVAVLTTTDAFRDARFPAVAELEARARSVPPVVDDPSFDYPVRRAYGGPAGAKAAIHQVRPDAGVARVGGRATLGFTRGVLRAARALPNALYFRDVEGVQLLDSRRVQPNLVLTNAQRITDLVATKGWSSPTIPS